MIGDSRFNNEQIKMYVFAISMRDVGKKSVKIIYLLSCNLNHYNMHESTDFLYFYVQRIYRKFSITSLIQHIFIH